MNKSDMEERKRQRRRRKVLTRSAVYRMRQEGATFNAIGEALGFSGGRAREIFRQRELDVFRVQIRREEPLAKRLPKKQLHPLQGLSTRARNAMVYEALYTAEAIEKYDAEKGLYKVPNIGPKTAQEIRQWLRLRKESPAAAANMDASRPKRKTRQEYVSEMLALKNLDDPERAHSDADEILLAYLREHGAAELAEAYDAVVESQSWWACA